MSKEHADFLSEATLALLIGEYPASRIKLFDRLLKKRPGIITGRFWELKPPELRFRHGETLAELRVPYHMGSDDETAVENAVLALIALLQKRYDPSQSAARKDAPVAESLITVGHLKDKTFRTDIFHGGSFEKRLAQEILLYTPFMDSAILANWLGPEGHGKKFVKWLGDLFEKTLKDEARHGLEERTSYLCLLAVINTVKKKKERTKDARIKGLTYERLDLAVGMPLFICLRSVLNELFTAMTASGAGTCAATEDLLMSTTVPRAFLAIPQNILSLGINPYGINQETFDALSKFTPDIAEGAKGISAGAMASLAKIKKDPSAMEAVRQMSAVAGFREAALRYMSEFDIPGSKAQQTLFETYGEDRLTRNLLNDPNMCIELSGAIEEVKEKYAKDAHRAGIASALQEFLTSASRKKRGGFWGGAKNGAAGMSLTAVEGIYALKADDIAEGSASRMRAFLVDRKAEFSQDMLIQEYNAGRLYRFSTDDRPVLNTLRVVEEGQLFVDMKDFTRKTWKVKEIAMAEFMKEYFYKPILNCAKRYGVGTGVAHDERGIWLTNLLGDAAIFTGGVGYLVQLAKDIQKIIGGYRVELMKRLPPGRGEELLAEAHKSYKARKEDLRQRRAGLEQSLKNNREAAAKELMDLAEEEHRLENTYRDGIEEAVKNELAAGLFISYGAKAEVISVDAVAGFAGPVKVAIGEKINEAARGTGRNAMVRAKIEMLLENERIKRRNKLLQYPFDVYINRIYSLRMPPELENAMEKLAVTRAPAGVKALTRLMAEEYSNDLKRIVSGETFSSLRLIEASTGIYNRGQALSKEALAAYIKESRGGRRFFKKEAAISGLARPLQEAFFFPMSTLELWFGVAMVKDVPQVEAFCRIGEAVFKGFESNIPTVVYELLSPDGDFFKALLVHHFHEWYEEKKKDAEGI